MEESDSKPPEITDSSVPEPTPEPRKPADDAGGLWQDGSLVPNQVKAFVAAWMQENDTAAEAAAILADATDSWTLAVAEVMEPSHVARILQEGKVGLVSRIVDLWTDAGNVECLKKLAVELSKAGLEAPSEEAAGLMLHLSRRLSIGASSVAKTLWERLEPVLREKEGGDLRAVAQQIQVGEVIEGLGEDDVAFWESCFSWDCSVPLSWDSEGARRRLARLARRIRESGVKPEGLEKIVPGCWWDEVTREAGGGVGVPVDEKAVSLAASANPPTSTHWGFTGGLGAGVILTSLAFIGAVEFSPEAGRWWRDRTQRLAVAESPGEIETKVTPVEVAAKESALPQVAAPTPTAPALPEAQPDASDEPVSKATEAIEIEVAPPAQPFVGPLPEKKSKAPQKMMVRAEPEKLPKSTHPNEQWRAEEANRIFDRYPDVKRVHGMVCRAPLRENLTLILGQESLLMAGTEEYGQFLQSLILRPPADQEIRDVVIRQAARYMPVADALVSVEKLTYPGSENRTDVIEFADLVLALNSSAMTEGEIKRLWSIIRKRPKQPE